MRNARLRIGSQREGELTELREYTVIAYLGLHDVQQEAEVRVTAAISPEAAASLILGETLVASGHVRDLRAKVSFDDISGGRKTVLLYRRPPN